MSTTALNRLNAASWPLATCLTGSSMLPLLALRMRVRREELAKRSALKAGLSREHPLSVRLCSSADGRAA